MMNSIFHNIPMRVSASQNKEYRQIRIQSDERQGELA